MDQVGVPRFLANSFRYALIIVVAFGLTGLAFAIAGFFEPIIVMPLAVAFAGIGFRLSQPIERHHAVRTPEVFWCAIAALTVVAAAGIFHGARHGEHLAIDRDPAITINAAKWLADNGSLEVEVLDSPFTRHPKLASATAGISETNSHSLQFQGDHFLAVLLAGANWLGGDTLMFIMPALIAALALLGLYVLLAVTTSPVAGLLMITVLGFGLPFTALARDAYTEIPMLLLVTAVLWLAPSRGAPSRRQALLIGLILGTMITVRLDAALLLLGWPLIMSGWRSSLRDRVDRGATLAVIAGFLPGATIALLDLTLRNRHYLTMHDSRIIAMWAGVLVAIVGTIASVAIVGKHRIVISAWLHKVRIRRLLALSLGAISAYAWLVRPVLNVAHGGPKTAIAALQLLNGLPIDATLRYTELTLEFQQWYYGAVFLVVGIFGLALAVLVPSIGRHLKTTALTLAPISIVYLVHPNAVPDQIWVMRRFLVGATVMLGFGAAVVVTALVRNRSLNRRVTTVVLIAFAVGLLVPTAFVTKPVRYASDQRGHLAGIKRACDVLGPNAAVVIPAIRDANSLFEQLPQPLRGWCGAEVAVANSVLTSADAKTLASGWEEQGRTLFVLANSAQQINTICAESDLRTVAISNQFLLQQTLTQPPRRYDTEHLDLVIGRVADCSLVDPIAAT